MTKMGIQFHAVIAILACALSLAHATDPGLLQDFCVATDDTNAAVSVNGMFCKNPQHVTSDDFFFSGLNIPGNTSSNPFGSFVRFALVDQFPGLNTLGVSMVRIDFARQGLNPPHSHPRASEILFVVEGTLYAGFVTSNPDHRLFTKILHPGDAFVFPQGLIHFQLNVGRGHALAYASFSSQSPGVITLANSVFGADPLINSDVLTKGFQLDRKAVDYLQSLEWPSNGNY